jgi:hypothetical protein
MFQQTAAYLTLCLPMPPPTQSSHSLPRCFHPLTPPALAFVLTQVPILLLLEKELDLKAMARGDADLLGLADVPLVAGDVHVYMSWPASPVVKKLVEVEVMGVADGHDEVAGRKGSPSLVVAGLQLGQKTQLRGWDSTAQWYNLLEGC